MKELKFNFKKISLEKQFLKIQEELGELIKAINNKGGNIQDEMGDVILSVYGLSQILGLDYEETINKCIKKVNNRYSNR